MHFLLVLLLYFLQVKLLAMGGEHPLRNSYRYMFEKMRDAAEVLDDGINVLANQMKEQLGTEEFSHLRGNIDVSEVYTIQNS